MAEKAQAEPTMEEILASIRKIISDEGDSPQKGSADSQAEEDSTSVPVSMTEDDGFEDLSLDDVRPYVRSAFHQRRKMLRAALKGFAPGIEDHLEGAGIRPTDRAETVSLQQFCALARSLDGA